MKCQNSVESVGGPVLEQHCQDGIATRKLTWEQPTTTYNFEKGTKGPGKPIIRQIRLCEECYPVVKELLRKRKLTITEDEEV